MNRGGMCSGKRKGVLDAGITQQNGGLRGGGGHSHICPVQVCAAVKTPLFFT